MGIKVLPPDVNESNVEYTPRGQDIRFGLAAIRNVGEGVVNLIIQARSTKGRFNSFGDFLAKVDGSVCNKKTIESLIKGGAFDSLNHSRKGLMSVHLLAIDSVSESKRAEAIGQFDLFGSANDAGVATVELDIPNDEWDKATLLNYEREMLGLYVSDHPLLGVEGLLRSNSDISISELADEESGTERMVNIAGLITGVQRKVSRQGASWAIVTIEDLEGSIDVMFFSNTYNQYAMSLIEDRVVKIRGRVDWRDEQLRFTAMEMTAIDLTTGPVGPFTVSANSNQLTQPVIERIKETLRMHPGKREVQLVVTDQGKTTTHKLSFQVTSSPSLSADLKAILGADCVK